MSSSLNQAPTDIRVSDLTVREGLAGAVIGVVGWTDPDAGDTPTYSVSDTRFEIVGGMLKLKPGQALDYEAGASVPLTLTVTDAAGASYSEDFAVTVTNVNEAPTKLSLASTSFTANTPGAVVGQVIVADPDAGDTHSFRLTNNNFEIVSGVLKLKAGKSMGPGNTTFDILVTDAGGQSIRQKVTLEAVTSNSAPTGVTLSANRVEAREEGAEVGRVIVADPDVGDTHSFRVSDSRFEVVDGMLRLKAGKSVGVGTITLTVVATDAEGASVRQQLELVAAISNTAPTGIMLDGDRIFAKTPGAEVGRITVVDADAGDTHTFRLSDKRFEVVDGVLRLKEGESLGIGTLKLTVVATDAGGLSVPQTFSIASVNPNTAPTGLTLSSTSFAAKTEGAVVGSITVTDPDAGDSHSFRVSSPNFEVVDGVLRLKEGKQLPAGEVTVTIVVVDSAKAEYRQTVTLMAEEANRAPTNITLASTTFLARSPGAEVGRITVTDADAGDSHSFRVSNSSFEVVGGVLRLKEGKQVNPGTLTLTVVAVDSAGAEYRKTFQIDAALSNTAPTDILLSETTMAARQKGAIVGALSVVDPDLGDTHSYKVSDKRFEVVGGLLKLKDDQEVGLGTVKITITATDQAGASRSEQVVLKTELVSTAKPDAFIGTSGNDGFIIDHVGDTITEQADGGLDTAYVSIGFVLPDHVENLAMSGNAPLTGTGNALANAMQGNGAANTLYGLDGDDRLDGGGGADQLVGGRGNDTYLVDNVNDRVVEVAGQGTDTVYSTVDHVLDANVERLVLTGTAALTGTGNALHNVITANDAGNTLYGLAGNDTLIGGLGDDTLIGGAGNDILRGGYGLDILTGGAGRDEFVLARPTDIDIITDFNAAEDVIRLLRSGYASKAEVLAALQQAGENVVLNLSGGHAAIFRDAQLSDFADATFLFGEGPKLTAKGESYKLKEDTTLAIDAEAGLLKNDNTALTLAEGSVGSFLTAQGGWISIGKDGQFFYQPRANFNGADSFVYRLLDEDGSVAEAKVTFNVTSVYDAPALARPSFTSLPAEARGVDLRFIVNPGDAQAPLLEIDWGDGSSKSKNAGGDSHVYAADGNYTATLRLMDGTKLASTSKYAVQVGNAARLNGTAGNDILLAGAGDTVLAGGFGDDVLRGGAGSDSFLIGSGSGRDVILDFDAATDRLVLSNTPLWTETEVRLAMRAMPDGVLLDFLASFPYQPSSQTVLFAGKSLADLGALQIQFGTGNGVTAVNDVFAVQEDITKSFNAAQGLLKNDTGADGGLSVRSGTYSTTLGGQVSINSDGSFTYTGAQNFNGTDSFTYLVRDVDGSTASARATLNVAPVYDKPVYEGLWGAEATPTGSLITLGANPGDSDAARLVVTWGDNQTSTLALDAGNSRPNTPGFHDFAHDYAAGSYTARIELWDGSKSIAAAEYAVRVAGAAASMLTGTTKSDLLIGGNGDDRLTGGKGDDLMNGGAGRDVFVYAKGDGSDKIDGFAVGEDVLRLSGFGTELDSFGDILARSADIGGGVAIATGNDGTVYSVAGILLSGLSKADLTPDMFVFG